MRIKKFLAFTLASALLVTAVPFSADAATIVFKDGDNVVSTNSVSGNLTVSGGVIYDKDNVSKNGLAPDDHEWDWKTLEDQSVSANGKLVIYTVSSDDAGDGGDAGTGGNPGTGGNEPTVSVNNIKLNFTTLSLNVGEKKALTATVEPETATDKTVTWSSSDPNVAAVDANGNVTAVGEGTTTITATADGIEAKCEVTVKKATSTPPTGSTGETKTDDSTKPAETKPAAAVTAIKVDQDTLKLTAGNSKKVTATVTADTGADTTVTWSSSDEKVATVATDGTVKAVKKGTATITAKAGDKTAAVKVTVVAPTVKLNVTSIPLQKGKSTTAVAVTKINDDDAVASWSTSNKKNVTVKKNGKLGSTIKGVKAGTTATITVKTKLGATAKVKVTVQKKAVALKSVKANVKSKTLKVKDKFTIVATKSPLTATDKVTFTSSNKKVATVSSKGVVTAKKKGKATITVKAGSKKATVKITVKK